MFFNAKLIQGSFFNNNGDMYVKNTSAAVNFYYWIIIALHRKIYAPPSMN